MRTIFRFSMLLVTIIVVTACNLGTPSTQPGIVALPNLSLTIQAQNPAGGFAVGQNINYLYTVLNVGSTRLEGPVSVTDNKVQGIQCPDLTTVETNKDKFLDPGEKITCTGVYPIQQADVTAGSVSTTATAVVSGNFSNQASAVVKAPENKVLALTMSANPTTYSQAGQQIALEYVLTNTGNVPLGPGTFLVTDSHIALPITCGVPNATIPPNTQVKCNATYLIAQGDVNAGSVVFSASANGGGASTTANATVTITVATTQPPVSNPSNYVRGSTIQYKVVKGEWLIQIARCFGVDPKALTQANPQLADPNEISIGDVLTIPNLGSSGTLYGPPCVEFYPVQAGDTWNSIAQKFNADIDVLRAANVGVSLSTGTSVRVPKNSAGGAASVPVTPSPTTCNQAQMVADVSVPDGTTLAPGSSFTKTWRLKNVGTCTWTSAYTLIFDHGERMDAPATAPFTTVNIPPGSTVDLSINLKAPVNPGNYQADFRLRSPEGISFGIGAGGQSTFWVKIVVSGTTTFTDLVSLLGKKISGGAEVQAFQTAYTNGPCPETTAGSGVLDCKSKANESPFVRLVASDPANLANSTIREIRIFPKYTGTLPEGLTWTMTKQSVEAKLGLPLATPIDNGDITVDVEYKPLNGNYRLWITFGSNEAANVALMRRIRIIQP
jgi:LysM repeat protein